MKTVILNIPDKNEKWYRTLFNQLNVKHKVLSEEEKEDLLLAKLIDESMSEKGEIEKEKVLQYVKKHGSSNSVSIPELPAGTYIVRFTGENINAVKKIVKE